jgi:hypothetical protein
MIESVKRRTAAEIEGSRARMDAQRFADWLRSEMDKANAEPALKAFDTVLRASHSTPHDAADSLAALIEMDICHFINDAGKIDFDPNRVNWQTQWDSAAHLLFIIRPEKSDGWKYRRAFADYMAAVKAEARAGIFAEAISENTPGTRNPKQKPKAEPPAFADLFVSAEAMEKALQAARAVGLINEANRWTYGGKVGAIVIFWDFLRGREYLLNPIHANNRLAIESIAAFFGSEKPADRTERTASKYRLDLLRDLKTIVK